MRGFAVTSSKVPNERTENLVSSASLKRMILLSIFFLIKALKVKDPTLRPIQYKLREEMGVKVKREKNSG